MKNVETFHQARIRLNASGEGMPLDKKENIERGERNRLTSAEILGKGHQVKRKLRDFAGFGPTRRLISLGDPAESLVGSRKLNTEEKKGKEGKTGPFDRQA